MADENRAGMNLTVPLALAQQNLRAGEPFPFTDMALGIGSYCLRMSQFFDDFTQWRGPVVTGTGGGWEVINVGSTIGMDVSDALSGNGKVLLTSGTGASDHFQISSELPITAMGAGVRQVFGCRVQVDDPDEMDFRFGLHTAGGNLFSLVGLTDRLLLILQGLNAGNLAIVSVDQDSGGPSSVVIDTDIRDEMFAAISTVLWVAMVVQPDNSVQVLYSTDNGNKYKEAVVIANTQANLPDAAADTMAIGLDIQSTLGNVVACSVDWMAHSKMIG